MFPKRSDFIANILQVIPAYIQAGQDWACLEKRQNVRTSEAINDFSYRLNFDLDIFQKQVNRSAIENFGRYKK